MKTHNLQSYLLVTPCRDEADYIQLTIDSIANQSILPSKWVIVDDGSTDATPDILAKAEKEHDFITVLRREDRGERAVGPGVIEAFNEGLSSTNLDEFEYICKLDGDLGLPPRYFEVLINRMEADPLLGNLSGKTYIKREDGEWVSERMGDENAIGAAKFYRTSCFRDIGGFVNQVCWDGIDGHVCRMKGWIAGSSDEDELRIKHYRPQGSSQQSVWVGRMRWGRGKYFMGSSLLYVAAVSIYRVFEYPFIIGGVGIFTGYLAAMIKKIPRHNDEEYLRFFRGYEFQSLVFGKRKTLLKYNDRIRQKANAS